MVAVKYFPSRTVQLKDIEPETESKLEPRPTNVLGVPKKPFYYYVKDGDFSIVWENVFLLGLGHLCLAQTMYNAVFSATYASWYTGIYSEYAIRETFSIYFIFPIISSCLDANGHHWHRLWFASTMGSSCVQSKMAIETVLDDL